MNTKMISAVEKITLNAATLSGATIELTLLDDVY